MVNKVCEKNTPLQLALWLSEIHLIFSKGNTYHKELGASFDLPFLLPHQKEKISKYLESRWSGADDWIHFNRDPKALGNNKSRRKRVVFYSSVDWDAALHFEKNIYESQFHFVDCLLGVAKNFPDMQFIIRVHPAESTGNHPSYTKLENMLPNAYPQTSRL